MIRIIHKILAFLLELLTPYQVIAWDGRGRIEGIGLPHGYDPQGPYKP